MIFFLLGIPMHPMVVNGNNNPFLFVNKIPWFGT